MNQGEVDVVYESVITLLRQQNTATLNGVHKFIDGLLKKLTELQIVPGPHGVAFSEHWKLFHPVCVAFMCFQKSRRSNSSDKGAGTKEDRKSVKVYWPVVQCFDKNDEDNWLCFVPTKNISLSPVLEADGVSVSESSMDEYFAKFFLLQEGSPRLVRMELARRIVFAQEADNPAEALKALVAVKPSRVKYVSISDAKEEIKKNSSERKEEEDKDKGADTPPSKSGKGTKNKEREQRVGRVQTKKQRGQKKETKKKINTLKHARSLGKEKHKEEKLGEAKCQEEKLHEENLLEEKPQEGKREEEKRPEKKRRAGKIQQPKLQTCLNSNHQETENSLFNTKGNQEKEKKSGNEGETVRANKERTTAATHYTSALYQQYVMVRLKGYSQHGIPVPEQWRLFYNSLRLPEWSYHEYEDDPICLVERRKLYDSRVQYVCQQQYVCRQPPTQ